MIQTSAFWSMFDKLNMRRDGFRAGPLPAAPRFSHAAPLCGRDVSDQVLQTRPAPLFAFLERLIDPFTEAPAAAPPRGLMAFFWYHIRQVRRPLLVLLGISIADALLDASIPFFVGKLVDLLNTSHPRTLFAEHGWLLAGMAAVLLLLRPLVLVAERLITNVGIVAPLTTMLRWQHYTHVARQSLNFFQKDFAGRVATRVMQTGSALRQAVLSVLQTVLYLLFFSISTVGLLAAQDWRLAMPSLVWLIVYVAMLRWFVPRLRERSKRASEGRSMLTGKVVDSFTNIHTVKLFSSSRHEDAYMRTAMLDANDKFLAQQRLNVAFAASMTILNAVTLTATGALCIWLWQDGAVTLGAIAMAMPLVMTLVRMSGWVGWEIAGIFENIGVVQEGMDSITPPLDLVDRPGAGELVVDKAHIRFEHARFGYGRALPVLDGISLDIRPGEKVGLVGRSGAGKSTLVNLLLRFYDLESGRILIDGQDIAGVTQESLRAAIAVVTQDTALMHRSIGDNIRYGRQGADRAAVMRAAEQAHAAGFIATLEDWLGRKGYDAHVGERGVKLSGGQRQRIAIARVILKDAPILVLDEATSALDSEVEAAIQESLGQLMEGKTVLAIAHRLSTLQMMDRIVVIDEGRILEQGSHAELIAEGGLYAELWARQTGDFLIMPKALDRLAAE